LPSHIQITTADIDHELSRRRLGFGRGARQHFEADKVTITGGNPIRRNPRWTSCNSSW
jgi:chorismate synthase